jgi:hypothetical protein
MQEAIDAEAAREQAESERATTSGAEAAGGAPKQPRNYKTRCFSELEKGVEEHFHALLNNVGRGFEGAFGGFKGHKGDICRSLACNLHAYFTCSASNTYARLEQSVEEHFHALLYNLGRGVLEGLWAYDCPFWFSFWHVTCPIQSINIIEYQEKGEKRVQYLLSLEGDWRSSIMWC